MFLEVFSTILVAVIAIASLVVYYVMFLPECLEDTENKAVFLLLFIPYVGWLTSAIELYKEIGREE